MSLVKIREMSFKRGARVIFRGINLDIHAGKITAIMGPSGTGKTTLLRLIGAQLCMDSGSIEVFGENIHRLSQRLLYQLRERIGMLFQNGGLFTNLSTYENVAFPLREHTQLPEEMIRDIVLLKLQAIGLRGARDLMPSELSGGMARRVALARALALDPELILYDEPFTGQDPICKGVVVELIQKINRTLGTTSVLVSHDVAETLSIADYVYVIADGSVIGEGTPEEIRHHNSPLVNQFIEGLADGVVPFHYPAKSLVNDMNLVEVT